MNYTTLHLSLIPSIGPLSSKRVMGFLAHNGLDEAWLYRATVKDMSMTGVSATQAQLIVSGLRDRALLDEEIRLIHKHNITILLESHDAYPWWLRSIHAPPSVLYVQGDYSILKNQKFVGVVGSRDANAYGRSVVEALVPVAIQAGWGIVSGGARGIDSYAHDTTVRHGGSTVAVLGSGLLRPYPPQNIALFNTIVGTGGVVISPFPLQMSALPGNFPARNRIIAGMSRSCVVVQAAEKSGALITASYALAEGRDVGVVPGSIFDPLSVGCHKLLRDGATPLVSADEFKIFLGEEATTPVLVQQTISLASSEPLYQKQVTGGPSSGDSLINDDPIVRACMQKACSFDELLPCVADASDELYHRLWDLQLQGKVFQTTTGLWQAT